MGYFLIIHDDDYTFTGMDTKIGSPIFYTRSLPSVHKYSLFIFRILLVMH